MKKISEDFGYENIITPEILQFILEFSYNKCNNLGTKVVLVFNKCHWPYNLKKKGGGDIIL